MHSTKIKKRGVPLQIIMLIEEMLNTNPDMKPKEILQTLTKKRKANEILEKEIQLQKSKKETEDNVKIKQPKKQYLFPSELLPELTQVSIIDTFFS